MLPDEGRVVSNFIVQALRELAELTLKLTGSRSKLVFQPLPRDDPRQRQPDISLARSSLGWAPAVALEEGLQRTIAYFKSLH
jgi:UDP-glucuronate decarboxylase